MRKWTFNHCNNPINLFCYIIFPILRYTHIRPLLPRSKCAPLPHRCACMLLCNKNRLKLENDAINVLNDSYISPYF